MVSIFRATTSLSVFLAAACATQAEPQDAIADQSAPDSWYAAGRAALAARKALAPNNSRARNVILFVADGMDPTTVAAARIYDGQTRGEPGEENYLSFETFPYLGMAKTYNTDSQTPDSAGTMTAMTTGAKTKIEIIAVSEAATRGDCASSLGAHLETIFERVEKIGLATGVVTTARLTHATPAAAYAHVPDRNWENDAGLPAGAYETGCRDIASQLIDFPYGDVLEIAMGGGRSNFLPDVEADPEEPNLNGARKDGRNLVDEWRAKSPNHIYVWNEAQFNGLSPDAAPRPLGLFNRSHMEYEADRERDAGGEPSLEAMTRKSIAILSRHTQGYVLVVEGGKVDLAHHAGNAARALHETQEFSEAVAAAREMTSARDTLIIVTADHGHTMSFAGYPERGADILGLATSSRGRDVDDNGFALAADGKPTTTLSYANGPGALFSGQPLPNGRPLLTAEEVEDLDFKQPAIAPMEDETHGGQDVTVYASGPKAHLIGGVFEQNYIYHVMVDALGL